MGPLSQEKKQLPRATEDEKTDISPIEHYLLIWNNYYVTLMFVLVLICPSLR